MTTRFKPKLKGFGKKRKLQDPDKPGKFLPGKWKDEIAFQVYDLLKAGHSLNQAIQILGYREVTVRKWAKNVPLMKLAVALAKAQRAEETTLSDDNYIYKTLPPELHQIWKEIVELGRPDAGEGASDKLKQIIGSQGKRARQHLWVHAFVDSRFNKSEACRRTLTTKACLTNWLKDESFAALLDHIQLCKKDLVESKLFELIEGGETSAILFASRTLNRDRGYGDNKSIQIDQTTTVRNLIDIDQLNLTLEVRKAILEAIRLQQGEKGTLVQGNILPQVRAPINMSEVIDAEIVKDVVDEENSPT